MVYEKRGKEKVCEADRVLIAAGRVPTWKELGLSESDVKVKNRAIDVDQCLRTSVEGIYAIGDVTVARCWLMWRPTMGKL